MLKHLWPFSVIQRQKQEIVRLDGLLKGDFEQVASSVDEDGATLSFKSKTTTAIANALIKVYQNCGGANYLSISYTDNRDSREYEIIIQRKEGESPAEKASRLQAELDALKSGQPKTVT